MIFWGSGLPKINQKSMKINEKTMRKIHRKLSQNQGAWAQNGSKIHEKSVKIKKKGGPEIDVKKYWKQQATLLPQPATWRPREAPRTTKFNEAGNLLCREPTRKGISVRWGASRQGTQSAQTLSEWSLSGTRSGFGAPAGSPGGSKITIFCQKSK